MTVEEYQHFLEFIGTIDVLEGIDDFAPDWKPLTKEEYHARYIEKIKAGIPAGNITQEMFDFAMADWDGTLSSPEDRAIAFKAVCNMSMKKHPEYAENIRMQIAAVDAAVKQGKSVITVDNSDDIVNGYKVTFSI